MVKAMIPPTSDPADRMRELERLCKEMADLLGHFVSTCPDYKCTCNHKMFGPCMCDYLQGRLNDARAALKRYKEAKL